MLIEEGKDYKVYIRGDSKIYKSPEAHYIFDMRNGFTYMWGKTPNEDPLKFPTPNILDIEITTKCTGLCGTCYKCNLPDGENMSFDTFKAKAAFCERFGYDPYEKFIKGEVFENQVERVE